MKKENIFNNLNVQFPKENLEANLIEEENGYISVNGLFFLPIKLPVHYNSSTITKIIDEEGNEMGQILYLDKESLFEVNSLTELHYSCLLIEIETDEIVDSEYRFKYDYLLIEKEHLNRYLQDYKDKSPIWGGFFHIDELSNNKFETTKAITTIIANKNVSSLENYREILEQVVLEINPFNRFLKLYHLLELQFDMHTALHIRKLLDAGNKEKEISDTLRDYGRDDIDRLKSLFKSKINIDTLEPYLNNILSYKQIAKNIFYYREKDSNPLRSIKNFEKLFILETISKINFDQTFGENSYETKIIATIAYWIYRVRNCIAHNKLGEYVITRNDEDFVVDFAEPLIREVVKQCYKNETVN